ncbi:hypothetical protein THAOC_19233 [Thalassiosira oceanica]|uniref:FAD-binding PCMH-type domain-containing protein n=1 Tax=Thalassiosira oceanica TaxID=159749 RepID=K0SPV6_THAOC|nr:hypothetical protein THAOC_19233 [Thalassiosira oceanica]|eukprot:EJK60422.1 hypothetical protein THAOC_19233 [Thalassiosira oceanica]
MKFAALATLLSVLAFARESGAEIASIRGRKNSLEEQTPSKASINEAKPDAEADVLEEDSGHEEEDTRVTDGFFPHPSPGQFPSPSHGQGGWHQGHNWFPFHGHDWFPSGHEPSWNPGHNPVPSWHQPSGPSWNPGHNPVPSPGQGSQPRGENLNSLNSVLGREAVKDVTVRDFISHCTEELRQPYDLRTNWHLQVSDLKPNSGQTSALCMAIMFCAFKDCNPNPRPSSESLDAAIKRSVESRSNGGIGDNGEKNWGDGSLPRGVERWIQRDGNPSSNLPKAEMLPISAFEVVQAVKFARENGHKLSIKNSGHRADTLLLGMKKMPKLSPDNIMTCDSWRSYAKFDPCRLAVARDKPGYVQIGGGENFAEVYLSVRKYNDGHGYPFQAFGGASATVSPFGYSMMGGLSGTTSGRKHGFGADQILMVEMVLPAGHHVKFGPTNWRRARNSQLAPQTTEVEGQCCKDYSHDGQCNVRGWGDCTEYIPFAKLWKSVRGGGGGWGVVISISQQLHEYQQFEMFQFNNPVIPLPRSRSVNSPTTCGEFFADEQTFTKFGVIALNFYTQYYLNATYFKDSDDTFGFTFGSRNWVTPEYVPYGVDFDRGFDEKRLACSTPSAASFAMFCDGAGSAGSAFDATDATNLKAWVDANEAGYGGGKPNRFDRSVRAELRRGVSPQDYCIGQFEKKKDNTLRPGEQMCLAAEFDGPDFSGPTDDSAVVLIPAEFFGKFRSALDYGISLSYLAYGPGTMHVSDGMDSVTPAMRKAGTHSNLELIPKSEPAISGILPAFINPMHATPNTRGPQKRDWKKACPLNWSKAQRDRDYGTMTPPYGVGDLDDDVLDELRRRCPRKADETLFAPQSQKEDCKGFGIKTCPSVLDCQANNPVGHNFNALAFGTHCGNDPSGQACLVSLCVCCEGVNLVTTPSKKLSLSSNWRAGQQPAQRGEENAKE